jgi:hypothetical protein
MMSANILAIFFCFTGNASLSIFAGSKPANQPIPVVFLTAFAYHILMIV